MSDTAPSPRPRRGRRIALLSVLSVVVVLALVAGGIFAFVNHEAGSIHRIPVKVSAQRPGAGMTILLTGNQVGYTGTKKGTFDTGETGFIMLLLNNAGQNRGVLVFTTPHGVEIVPGDELLRPSEAVSNG